MSRFFSSRYADLTPYTPGEQPKEQEYIKLNTNESPFWPSEEVAAAVVPEAVMKLRLYSDPDSRDLTKAVAKRYSLKPENVLMTNGSDEILNFAFMAFCDEAHPIVFPDITYGFYSVFAQLNHIPYETVPLRDDFTIDYKQYCGINKNICIANPNAPTGILLPLSEIEEIVKTNPNNIVIIDEAYIDFADESCLDSCTVSPKSAVNLIEKYDNLLVTMTFSKSRSLAGGRLGFCLGNAALINDLNTIKYSTNPYNVNRMTAAAGLATLKNDSYYMSNCKTIIENREYLKGKLEDLGFTVLPSSSNFLFASLDGVAGKYLYEELKKAGILVRHFDKERISPFVRITIGFKSDLDTLVEAIKKIIG